MTRRPKPRPTTVAGALLDWSDRSHWSYEAKPCRYCGRPTHLRDSSRSPADKVCAEKALTQQAADTAAAYQNGTIG
ncbi:hypothetical protein [Streptomyces clavifer]|uniref:hypothetical protein n=1 Tax=Streptomyces clavifer TaxID=68188 RepID=UPI00308BA3FC|nr:hypothetical protein OG388_26825 [Streptomyces clavifer]